MTDLDNDLKNKEEKLDEYNFIINEEKGKNYELQKKLKELNEKLASLENENIQNININGQKYVNRKNSDINSKQLIHENYNIIKNIYFK